MTRFAITVLLPALAAIVGAAACGVQARNNDEPPAVRSDREAGAEPVAVLLRGRINPEALAIEPVFRTDAPASLPPADGGPHRLRGVDDEGETLFDLRFAGTPVADLPGGTEEHFSFVVPVEAGGELRLNRVELRAADGRETVRQARLSARELLEAAGAEGAVTVEPAAEGRIRVRWDASVFPMVVIRDPDTKRILTFGRGGDATVATDRHTVELILSEGVRSAARIIEVRR